MQKYKQEKEQQMEQIKGDAHIDENKSLEEQVNDIIVDSERGQQLETDHLQEKKQPASSFKPIQGQSSLEKYIEQEKYQKVKDQLILASQLYKQDESIAIILYLYLQADNKQYILKDQVKDITQNQIQNQIRSLVESALKHNLYMIARTALRDFSLPPKNRDLLKIAFQNNSSGQIKLVCKLLLQGGPLYSQVDTIQQVEIKTKIIEQVNSSHDRAAQMLVELSKKYNIQLQFPFSIIKNAFQQKSYGFLQSYLDSYDLIIESSSILDLVIDTLEDQEGFIHGVYYLQFISILKINEEYMLKLIDVIEDILENQILQLSQSVVPQITVSVLANFIDDLVPRFKRFQVRLEGLRDSLKQLAILFMEENTDSLSLEKLYLKQILPCRYSLVEMYLGKKEFFQDLLNYPIVADFLQKNFNGKYKSDNNFLISSSSLKTIKGQNTQPIIKAYSSKNVGIEKTSTNFFSYIHSSLDEIDGVHNWFQYGIWKSSALFRLLISIFFHVAILIFILVISLQFFEEMRVMHHDIPGDLLEVENDLLVYRLNPSEKTFTTLLLEHVDEDLQDKLGEQAFNNLTTQEKEEKREETKKRIQEIDIWEAIKELDPNYIESIDKLKEDEDALNTTISIFKWVPFYFIITWFVSVFEIVNLYKRKGIANFNSLHVIDTIQLGLSIYLLAEFWGSVISDEVTLTEKIDILNVLEKIQAASLFFLWMKLLVYLKITSKFGVIIRIIELSLVDILNFLTILLIIEMAFVTLFFILFEDSNDNFTTFFITLRSATAMVLGNFDTTSFNDDQELGAILVILYMIITNVLVLNLLIAILSTTYEKISEMSTVEFSKIVYEYQKFTKTSKYHTGLVCAPSPLNILVLPFQLLSAITNNRTIDDITLKFSYILLLIFVFFPINLAFNLILSPFAYFMNFINILKSNNTLKALLKISIWFFIGILYSVFTALTYDQYIFLKMCFMKVYVRENLEKVDLRAQQLLSRYAKLNENQILSFQDALTAIEIQKQQTQEDKDKIQSKKVSTLGKKVQTPINEFQSPIYNPDIEILETEAICDEFEQFLTQDKVLGLTEILSRFCDHSDKIDFKHVNAVISHIKRHKISTSNFIVHCHNFKEIESALLKHVNQQEEEEQKEEDFQKLRKIKQE